MGEIFGIKVVENPDLKPAKEPMKYGSLDLYKRKIVHAGRQGGKLALAVEQVISTCVKPGYSIGVSFDLRGLILKQLDSHGIEYIANENSIGIRNGSPIMFFDPDQKAEGPDLNLFPSGYGDIY